MKKRNNSRQGNINPMPVQFGEPKEGDRIRISMVTRGNGTHVCDVWAGTPEEAAKLLARAVMAYPLVRPGSARLRGDWDEPPPWVERAALVFRVRLGENGIPVEAVAICPTGETRRVLKEVQDRWDAEFIRGKVLDAVPKRAVRGKRQRGCHARA